jgi:anthranilate phosphoribosyltransferase
MSISQYIKEIGRGKDGARSLNEEQAHDLMAQVLDGRVTDLELGAFAIAMRIKGESVPELAGFLKAAAERCLRLAVPRPAVLLPSYNGARRLPNLTPLLALTLAGQGVPVLVHGMPEDPTRVTSADVFRELGLPAARDAADILAAWGRREPAYIQTDLLCPPLARLLNARWTIGLRNSGHTIAKLLDPFPDASAVRVVNYTHPEYHLMLTEFLQHTGANAVLMRGTEGEPVADARRQPRLDVFIGGQPREDLALPAHEGVLRELPTLPRGFDAATTAGYIRSVLDGGQPLPGPLAQQVACLVRATGAIGGEAPAA